MRPLRIWIIRLRGMFDKDWRDVFRLSGNRMQLTLLAYLSEWFYGGSLAHFKTREQLSQQPPNSCRG